VDGADYGPDALMLYVYSVADFDAVDRLALIAAVFDEFAELRPLKCGPKDPPRIKVTTMGAALAEVERPFRYLLVRASEPTYEGGELTLHQGRGGYLNTQIGKGAPSSTVRPHSFSFSYDRDWFDASERYVMVAEFFRRMCEEMDAFYGFATSQALWLSRRGCMPQRRSGLFAQLDRELPDVTWLNYFGPSWLRRTNRMLGLGYGETRTSNGGVVLQTTETPFVFQREAHPILGYPWKQPLIGALGKDTFIWSDQVQGAPGERVPTWKEHFAVSPGTDDMPWVNWEADVDVADRKRAEREKTFPRKARATERLASARRVTPPTLGREEFSTIFDMGDDFRGFFRSFSALVNGDLTGKLGTALLAEIHAAPHNTERSYLLAVSPDGIPELIEFSYFIDDIDAVEVYLFGSSRLTAACHSALESLGHY